ncbi:EamA family transporter [Lysobacter korlensis]|uniref:EamA family transporter n=1 Tax=Lysobacter korlensis TaxID=553636 RepID=A0ABV6RVM5_9GAMM
MLTVLVGLSGALIFGAADFLGGVAAKRISPIRVVAISAATGFVVMLMALAVLGGEWSTAAVALGAVTGIVGAAAIGLLYACLAIGPMSILSPLTAVVSAIVPATWGLLQGDRLSPIGYVAIGIALVAVVLVGFVPERGAVRPTLPGLVMATASGALIGAFLILMDLTPDDSGLVPLVVNRAVNSTTMFLVVGFIALAMARRPRTTAVAAARGWRPGLWFAVSVGVLDSVANALILFGLRVGELSVMSVLTAMYPAGTILLAATVLRERIAPVQWVGLVLALAAAGMLSQA